MRSKKSPAGKQKFPQIDKVEGPQNAHRETYWSAGRGVMMSQMLPFSFPKYFLRAGSPDHCRQESRMSSRKRVPWQLLGQPHPLFHPHPRAPTTEKAVWVWSGHSPMAGGPWQSGLQRSPPTPHSPKGGWRREKPQSVWSSWGARRGCLPMSRSWPSPKNSVAEIQTVFTGA